jgi:hypothetical protein
MKLSTKLNIGISTLAILIALFGQLRDCSQNRKINKLEYEVNSLNFKPVIKVEQIMLSNFREKFEAQSSKDSLTDTLTIIENYKINTDITFFLKNVGNSKAKLIAAICTDTLSGNDIIKKSVLEKGLKGTTLKQNDYYLYLELLPNETKTLKFNKTIGFVGKESFTIHLLLLYQNDLDVLYDTYYWARFYKKEIIPTYLVDSTVSTITGVQFSKKSLNGHLKFIDDNNAYSIYSEKESGEVLNKLSESIK